MSGALSRSQWVKLPSRARMPLMFQVTIFMQAPKCRQPERMTGGARTLRRRACSSFSDGEAGPAAAGRNRVRILDLEGLAHQIVNEVDHRATHVNERQLVDQHRRAIAL